MQRGGMMNTASRVAALAAELRQNFDRAFAKPPAVETASIEDLLAIRFGANAFALRLSQIAGLFTGKKITSVPGGGATLLGIAGFRGSIVPVYDLEKLLGHSGSKVPRWLVIAAAAPVALAFEAFEGQLRVPRDSITPPDSQVTADSLTQGLVQSERGLRPIIHLPSVLGAIKA
jgi:purine-binding chemotaxis protein CheW